MCYFVFLFLNSCLSFCLHHRRCTFCYLLSPTSHKNFTEKTERILRLLSQLFHQEFSLLFFLSPDKLINYLFTLIMDVTKGEIRFLTMNHLSPNNSVFHSCIVFFFFIIFPRLLLILGISMDNFRCLSFVISHSWVFPGRTSPLINELFTVIFNYGVEISTFF